jgi:hypothetical protein
MPNDISRERTTGLHQLERGVSADARMGASFAWHQTGVRKSAEMAVPHFFLPKGDGFSEVPVFLMRQGATEVLKASEVLLHSPREDRKR